MRSHRSRDKKFSSRNLFKLGLGSVILLSWGQQASASIAPEDLTTTNSAAGLQLELPATEPLKLPPLGEPDPFLPREEIPTHLVIKLSDRRVYVYQGDQLQTSYPIAVGKQGWETPTGTFQVRQMIRNPSWQHPWTDEVVPPGPGNPLGSRWISFWTDGRNEIGFHGTPNEELIGQAVSHGCIRMRNQDVQALFEKVSVGTPVTVQP
ncbi:MAG: L,D-transpeptidase [Coleofasciculus sp. S288]|nr:L,D-transpeptidase [Coleofasciculus sp. S288]